MSLFYIIKHVKIVRTDLRTSLTCAYVFCIVKTNLFTRSLKDAYNYDVRLLCSSSHASAVAQGSVVWAMDPSNEVRDPPAGHRSADRDHIWHI
jgi:hypothetical protein